MVKETVIARLARARAKRAEADAIESAAIREALTAAQGFLPAAGKALHLSRDKLRQILRSRHPDLETYAAELRDQAGYRGGNPRTYMATTMAPAVVPGKQ